MQKNVIRYCIIFLSLFLASTVFAASEYNNELVRVDLDQTSDNSVKVNIYTEKPYKEQIIVNKKPNNKYVILLPETSNSMNIQPDISSASALRDVEVKTQQYSSLPGKGYTKITIDSKTPVDIVPQAFVTKKSTSSVKRTLNKTYVTPQQVQMTVPQRVLNQQRPVTNNDFTTSSYDRQRQTSSQQTVLPQQNQQTYTRRENYVPQIVQRQTENNNVQQPQMQTNSVVQTQTTIPENNISQDVHNGQALNDIKQDDNNSAIDDENSNKQIENDDISDDELAFFKKIIRFKQKLIKKIKQILSVRISFTSFMTVLQLILLLALVKIISDLVKKVQNPNEQVQPVTRRLIHDNNETFEQAYPSYSNMDVYNSNRSDFEEDNKEGFNITPLSAPVSFTSKNNVQQKQFSSGLNYHQPKLYSTQNDFYKPLNEINEEDKMSIFDENAQDIEKTIFKNPLTKISKHDEEILFDDVEPYEENSPFADEKYSTQDDFFNYSNSKENEEDFFIFEDEDDDEDVEYQEDYVEEDEEDEEDDDEYEYIEEDDDEDNIEQPQGEYLQKEQVIQQEEPKVIDPFEHLTVHSKYVIDSNRGFAQVSVDDVNALIGYVCSKISVIRKFKEQVNGTMQVRMNEQPAPDTMIYIVKVGSYKTLVEVKPNSIRQLLDL